MHCFLVPSVASPPSFPEANGGRTDPTNFALDITRSMHPQHTYFYRIAMGAETIVAPLVLTILTMAEPIFKLTTYHIGRNTGVR